MNKRTVKIGNVLDGSVREVVLPGKPAGKVQKKQEAKPAPKIEPKGDAGGKDKR